MTPRSEYLSVPLSHGQITIIDANCGHLATLGWKAMWSEDTQSYYAQCKKHIDGKRKTLLLHRLVVGLRFGDPRQVDHINRNTLDNRRSNLRIATRSQNQHNRGKSRNNTSGFKGVSFLKNSNRWIARISIEKQNKFLGRFMTAEEAHQAYERAAALYHGEFARVE